MVLMYFVAQSVEHWPGKLDRYTSVGSSPVEAEIILIHYVLLSESTQNGVVCLIMSFFCFDNNLQQVNRRDLLHH